MLDTILGYAEIAVLVGVSVAVSQRFRRVRGFNWLIAVASFWVVLKLVEAWLLFFMVMKPHASPAIADALTQRFDRVVAILGLAALTFALYHLGGKPARGFWQWLFSDNTNAQALSN
jgi:hypothetical protein